MSPELTSQLLGEEPAQPQAPYEFLQVNGFVYRCNRLTGDAWRLEAHATERKAQVWKKIEETHGA